MGKIVLQLSQNRQRELPPAIRITIVRWQSYLPPLHCDSDLTIGVLLYKDRAMRSLNASSWRLETCQWCAQFNGLNWSLACFGPNCGPSLPRPKVAKDLPFLALLLKR